MRFKILHVTLNTLRDPVILILSCLAAGFIAYHVLSDPSFEIKFTTSNKPLDFQFNPNIESYIDYVTLQLSRTATQAWIPVGIISALMIAYTLGFSRESGSLTLILLLGARRTSYIAVLVLLPLTTLIVISIISTLIAITLIDWNLLKIPKVTLIAAIIVTNLILATYIIPLIALYTLKNMFRTLIATLVVLYLLNTQINPQIMMTILENNITTITLTILVIMLTITYTKLYSLR